MVGEKCNDLGEDVKKTYPAQWVLIEAQNAKTEEDKRIIEQMDVINSFADDGDSAFQKYIELHKLHKEREYYIYHTSNETLNIGVKKWYSNIQRYSTQNRIEA
jgi:hypothetical protein